MPLNFFVLDQAGAPMAAPDAQTYAMGLLDPRRSVASNRLDLRDGYIWLQTEFIGVDDDGAGRLWQSALEWSSMLGRSMSFVRYTSSADAAEGHAKLLEALQLAVQMINNPPPS